MEHSQGASLRRICVVFAVTIHGAAYRPSALGCLTRKSRNRLGAKKRSVCTFMQTTHNAAVLVIIYLRTCVEKKKDKKKRAQPYKEDKVGMYFHR